MSSVITVSQSRMGRSPNSPLDNLTDMTFSAMEDSDLESCDLETVAESPAQDEKEDSDPELTTTSKEKGRDESLAKLQGVNLQQTPSSAPLNSIPDRLSSAPNAGRRSRKNTPDAVIVIQEEKVCSLFLFRLPPCVLVLISIGKHIP
jgi:hypothetical protein